MFDISESSSTLGYLEIISKSSTGHLRDIYGVLQEQPTAQKIWTVYLVKVGGETGLLSICNFIGLKCRDTLEASLKHHKDSYRYLRCKLSILSLTYNIYTVSDITSTGWYRLIQHIYSTRLIHLQYLNNTSTGKPMEYFLYSVGVTAWASSMIITLIALFQD